MCGIFGFISDKPSEENVRLFRNLCYLSAMRGTDSTGLAIVVKDKVIIDKAPIPSPKYIKDVFPKYEKAIAKANIVIGHTRKWTMGKPSDNNNNHPISSDNWVMVHNGCCPSMDRIKGYKYRGEVDSEILLSYVEELGIEKGLSHLDGYAAVALINMKQLDSIYLWRHNETIHLGYDRDSETIFFGSTEDIMENGLSNELLFWSSYNLKKLPEDTLYSISHTPLCVSELADIELIKKPAWYNKPWNKRDKDKEDYASTKKSYRYDVKLGMCVLVEDGTDKSNLPAIPTNRFYFPKQSVDFVHWVKVRNYYVSADGSLIKMWDKDKATHFMMKFDDAKKEGVLKEEENVRSAIP